MAAATSTLLALLSVLSFLASSDTVGRNEYPNLRPGVLRGGKEPRIKIRVRNDASDVPPLEEGWEPVPIGTFLMETEQSSRGPSSLVPEHMAGGVSASAESSDRARPNRTAAAAPEQPAEDRNHVVRRLVDQARVFRQEGNASAAETNLREALLLSNLAAAPLCEMLSLQMQQNKLAAANELLFRGIERHPDLAELYSLRGELFQRQGEVEAAERSLEHALTLSPRAPHALAQLAALLAAPARPPPDHERARRLIEEALGAAPGHAAALSTLGQLEERAGLPLADLRPALLAYRRAAQAAPGSWQAQSNLGACLTLHHTLQHRHPPRPATASAAGEGESESEGGLGEAERVLRGAVQLRPAHAPALANLALTLLHKHQHHQGGGEGDSGEALELLDKAVDLAPRSVATLSLYASALAAAKQLLPAHAAYLRAIELGHKDWTPEAFAHMLVGYGTLLEDMAGDTQGAAAAYDHALSLHPASPGASWRRGQLLWLWEGDAEGGEALLRAALASAPDHPDALPRLAMLLSDERAQHAEAEALLLRALAAHPANLLALQVYGEMLSDRGDAPAATALLLHAQALHPDLHPPLPPPDTVDV